MTDGRTLTRKTALALAQGPQASLAHLRMQPEFIWHRDAAAIEARLEEALQDALTGECEGTDYFLIVGPTGNGKSRLVKKLNDRHARPNDSAASVMTMPVLYTRMSVTGSPVGYVRTVLDKLGAKYSQSNSLDQLYPLLLRLLGRIGVRMLIIDELHHITFGQAIALFAVHTEGLFVESLQYGRAGRLKALSHEPLRRRRQPHELASLENRPAG